MTDSKTTRAILKSYWDCWVNLNEYLKLLIAVLLGIIVLLIIQMIIDQPRKELKIVKDAVEITTPGGEVLKLTLCGGPGQRKCAIFDQEYKTLSSTNFNVRVSQHKQNSVNCCYTFEGDYTFDFCNTFEELNQCPDDWWEDN